MNVGLANRRLTSQASASKPMTLSVLTSSRARATAFGRFNAPYLRIAW